MASAGTALAGHSMTLMSSAVSSAPSVRSVAATTTGLLAMADAVTSCGVLRDVVVGAERQPATRGERQHEHQKYTHAGHMVPLQFAIQFGDSLRIRADAVIVIGVPTSDPGAISCITGFNNMNEYG